MKAPARSLTEDVANWLAAHYALASRHAAYADDPNGWRLLREICHDVVELHRGDHSGRRIEIDRQRFAIKARDLEMRSKDKVEMALDALAAEIQSSPEAMEAFLDLRRQIRPPSDPAETA